MVILQEKVAEEGGYHRLGEIKAAPLVDAASACLM